MSCLSGASSAPERNHDTGWRGMAAAAAAAGSLAPVAAALWRQGRVPAARAATGDPAQSISIGDGLGAWWGPRKRAPPQSRPEPGTSHGYHRLMSGCAPARLWYGPRIPRRGRDALHQHYSPLLSGWARPTALAADDGVPLIAVGLLPGPCIAAAGPDLTVSRCALPSGSGSHGSHSSTLCTAPGQAAPPSRGRRTENPQAGDSAWGISGALLRTMQRGG